MATEYRRGTGPNALPQGAAAGLNRRQPSPRDAVGEMALENPHIPVQFAQGEADNDDDGPMSEDMELLLANPDPGFSPPVIAKTGHRVPAYTVRHLAAFHAAASAPDATPALRAAYQAVIHRLELERKAR